MKLTELLNIKKALNEAKQELEELNREKVELKQEINELKQEEDLIREMLVFNTQDHQPKLNLNINDVYVLKNKSGVHFVRKKGVTGYISMHDIFTNGIYVEWCKNVVNLPTVPEVYPEVKVYLDGKVPKLHLQKLYYQANHIDAKVLKKVMTYEED